MTRARTGRALALAGAPPAPSSRPVRDRRSPGRVAGQGGGAPRHGRITRTNHSDGSPARRPAGSPRGRAEGAKPARAGRGARSRRLEGGWRGPARRGGIGVGRHVTRGGDRPCQARRAFDARSGRVAPRALGYQSFDFSLSAPRSELCSWWSLQLFSLCAVLFGLLALKKGYLKFFVRGILVYTSPVPFSKHARAPDEGRAKTSMASLRSKRPEQVLCLVSDI